MLDTLFFIAYIGFWVFGLTVIIYNGLIKKKFVKRKRLDDDSFSSSNNYNNTNISSTKNSSNEPDLINPTTGALMVGGFAGVDTFGNSFGNSSSFSDDY